MTVEATIAPVPEIQAVSVPIFSIFRNPLICFGIFDQIGLG